MIYTRKDVSFEDIPQLSDRDKAYQRGDERLRPFIKYPASFESFGQVLKDRSSYSTDRDLLVSTLLKQYDDLDASEATLANIKSLGYENTFTIITAHQPSLLTGPLYFIIKICSVISLSKKLNEAHPDYKVVPVFVTGGEDHDFEEIATLHMFNKDFTWETDQKGSTGRMSHDGLDTILSNVIEVLGSGEQAEELKEIISKSQSASQSYGGFMVYFVNELFKKYGLVIANMDNAGFKAKLIPYIIKDIENKESIKSVEADQDALEAAGFKRQAHARKVNFFYMGKDRIRVVAEDDESYSIGDDTYTKDQLIALISEQPGSISPNVILRPIYQELIMPNLAYIGGGGELAYWVERRRLFDLWELPFPMLIRRDSLHIVDKKTEKTLTGAQMNIMDLFQREEQLFGQYARLQSDAKIDLSDEKKAIEEIFNQLKERASKIDPTLGKTALSEASKAIKSLDYLQSKMLKAEKTKNEVGINKLRKAKHKLFPGNDGLQERYDNFMPFYLRYGQDWIDEIIEHCDPMNKNFKILTEV